MKGTFNIIHLLTAHCTRQVNSSLQKFHRVYNCKLSMSFGSQFLLARASLYSFTLYHEDSLVGYELEVSGQTAHHSSQGRDIKLTELNIELTVRLFPGSDGIKYPDNDINYALPSQSEFRGS